MVIPYTDAKLEETLFIREFSSNVTEEELVWHRDFSSRNITVLEGKGWKLQLDNFLPEELVVGESYFIPSMEYHRLIKGIGKLRLKIRELK